MKTNTNTLFKSSNANQITVENVLKRNSKPDFKIESWFFEPGALAYSEIEELVQRLKRFNSFEPDEKSILSLYRFLSEDPYLFLRMQDIFSFVHTATDWRPKIDGRTVESLIKLPLNDFTHYVIYIHENGMTEDLYATERELGEREPILPAFVSIIDAASESSRSGNYKDDELNKLVAKEKSGDLSQTSEELLNTLFQKFMNPLCLELNDFAQKVCSLRPSLP